LGNWISKKLKNALVIIWFVLIAVNSIDYIGGFIGLSLEIRTRLIVGIVLVAIGMFVAKSERG
jgi:hypothetical protein